MNATPVPAFSHTEASDWINSDPLSWKDLRGEVVLLDFWTFMCWNCYRSFPWLNDLESRFEQRDFQVIGVHSPEFEAEKDRQRIVDKAEEFGLHHPIMIDNDHVFWRAMNNRFWPAFYLIDRQGNIRYRFIGETHIDSSQAKAIEAAIEDLLAEATAAP